MLFLESKSTKSLSTGFLLLKNAMFLHCFWGETAFHGFFRERNILTETSYFTYDEIQSAQPENAKMS